MKRILSLLLALTLVFALVACGKGKGTTSESDASTTSQPETESTDSNTTGESSSGTKTPSNSDTSTLSGCSNEKNENITGLRFHPQSDNSYGVSLDDALFLEEIIIPSSYNGKKITKICRMNFTETTAAIKKVTIPNTVVSIEDFAFGTNFSNLETITFEKNSKLQKIGECAFLDCKKLKNIFIPASIVEIGDRAFANCNSLKLTEYKNCYYFGNNNNPYLVLIKAKNKDINSCVIHQNTIHINYKAFYECKNLKNLSIPKAVSTISNCAFQKSGLETIEFSKNGKLKTIGEYAFEYTKIEHIRIPEGVTTFSWGIFSECLPTLDVIIPTTVTEIKRFNNYGANNGGNPVRYVYYEGNKSDWEKINIGFEWGDFLIPDESDLFFYSEKKPTSSNNSWHYVNGVPVAWN